MNQNLNDLVSMKPRRTSRCQVHVILGLVALVALGITGCGGSEPTPPLGLVKGKVSINGAPAPNLVVMFESQTPGGGRSGGVTNALGEFELSYLGATPNPKGAAVGKHIVRITSASGGGSGGAGGGLSAGGSPSDLGPTDDTPKADVVVIPDTYNANSGLLATVAAGENAPVTYDLKIPKK